MFKKFKPQPYKGVKQPTYQTAERLDALYTALCLHYADSGVPATIRDLCAATGLSSTSYVHWLLQRLTEEGYVEKVGRKYVPSIRHVTVAAALLGDLPQDVDWRAIALGSMEKLLDFYPPDHPRRNYWLVRIGRSPEDLLFLVQEVIRRAGERGAHGN